MIFHSYIHVKTDIISHWPVLVRPFMDCLLCAVSSERCLNPLKPTVAIWVQL